MIVLIKNENEIDSILPFFAQEKYLETKSSIYGWFVSEEFILPFVLFTTYIFKRIVFTTEPINKNNSSIEEEIAFLDHMQNYIKKTIFAILFISLNQVQFLELIQKMQMHLNGEHFNFL